MSNNFINNPEALLRKNRSRTTSSSTTPLTNKPFTPHHPFELPWPGHSVTIPPPLLPTCPLGPQSTLGMENSSFALAYSRWCRQTSSMACHMRMQMLIFNTSLSCSTPSSSKTSHQLASSFAYFLSPLRGKWNSGSTRARKLPTHGTNVPQHSSSISSPWAKSVL